MVGDGSSGGSGGESDGSSIDVEEVALRIALRRSLLKQGGAGSGGSSSSAPVAHRRSVDDVAGPSRLARSSGSSASLLSTTLWSGSGTQPSVGRRALAGPDAHEDAQVRDTCSPARAAAGEVEGGGASDVA